MYDVWDASSGEQYELGDDSYDGLRYESTIDNVDEEVSMDDHRGDAGNPAHVNYMLGEIDLPP